MVLLSLDGSWRLLIHLPRCLLPAAANGVGEIESSPPAPGTPPVRKGAQYIVKGAVVSVVETWTDENNELKSQPFVLVKQVQLPAKAA